MINTTIIDENGNLVDYNYLLNIVEISNSPEDYIKKANYGITEIENSVSLENDDLLREFYILNRDKF